MINSDPTLTRALQDEMKLLKEKGRRLDGLYNRSREQIKNLQKKLDTCENQNGAIFGIQSNNQVCQRKIEGIDQTYSFKMIVSILQCQSLVTYYIMIF